MKQWFVITLFISARLAPAQSVSTLMGARPAGMGFVSTVLTDESSIFNNIGASGRLTRAASFFAYEVQPALKGANRMAAGMAIPIKFGVTSIGFFRFGDALYSEQTAGLGFSNTFGIASLGARINYVQYSAEGFGTRSTLRIDFGGVAQITPQISVGAYVLNLGQAKISDSELLPVKLVAGIGFKPSEKLLLTTELEKDLDYRATVRAGLEYVIHKKVFARTGFNLNPSAGFAGLGVQVKRLKIDYAIQFGNVLNAVHQTSAVYLLSREKGK
ncbi:MAG: hypothetical protein K2U26_10520 [Cyclobacteriaceae bacterium]|nr:hypothetical protein [Cyclobacteriaceae bacterium]